MIPNRCNSIFHIKSSNLKFSFPLFPLPLHSKFLKMNEAIIVYHNPRCSKSRCALDFLNVQKLDFKVIEYLKDFPSKTELQAIIDKLGIAPEALVRKGEEEYKQHFKGKTLSNDEWIDAMIQFPKLIERPIVVVGNKAVIARPTERILVLL